MNLRLLLVIDSLASGGAQRQIVNLACGLLRQQCDVEMFMYHPEHLFFADLLKASGITVHAVRKRWRFSVHVVRALRARVRQGRYDAVVSFLNTPNVYAELARVGLPQVTLVVSERNTFAVDQPGWRTWPARRLHGLADHVTANTHVHAAAILASSPWLAGRVSTIYNGVDLERFRPPAVGSRPPGQPIRLLAVGSIIRRKNMAVLLHGLDRFRRRHATLPFVVRWAGRRREDREGRRAYTEADNLRRSLALEPTWTWLGEQREIPALLAGCDALVHPGYREGLPNAICEALACGRPVLAARVADNARLVDAPNRGFLFDPHSPDDVAAALEHLVAQDSAQRRAMEKDARRFAEEHLSLDRYARSYKELVERLVDERSRRPAVTESDH